MEKGLHKMLEQKRAIQKKKDKALAAEQFEREEEERVAAEQKQNLFWKSNLYRETFFKSVIILQ